MRNNLEKTASALKRDTILSSLYFTGRCATAVGIAYMGASVLKDASAERYFGAVVDAGVCAGLCAVYSEFGSAMERVSQRIKRNKVVLESRLAEDYGK